MASALEERRKGVMQVFGADVWGFVRDVLEAKQILVVMLILWA